MIIDQNGISSSMLSSGKDCCFEALEVVLAYCSLDDSRSFFESSSVNSPRNLEIKTSVT